MNFGRKSTRFLETVLLSVVIAALASVDSIPSPVAEVQDTKPSQPTIRMRSFGRLPDWAKQSWFIQRQMDQPWMLRNVNVIDVRRGVIQERVNIIIAADEIQSIGTDQPTARMKVVDAAGHYVIPGLSEFG